jgi:Zn-dependent oligopeptidase
VRNEKVLKKISGHFKTGKKIPSTLIKSIIEQEKFLKGTYNIRQLLLGILDYELHTKGIKNPEK